MKKYTAFALICVLFLAFTGRFFQKMNHGKSMAAPRITINNTFFL